jgi:hypothetical protein
MASVATLQVVFDGKFHQVPKKSVFDLLTHERDLLDARTDAVRPSVPRGVFEEFADSLKSFE